MTSALLLLATLGGVAPPVPLKVCLVSGSAEYDSDASLATFKTYLEGRYVAKCTLVMAKGMSELPGLEALDDCDVALLFTRRLTIDGEPLERIKRYCRSGKPLVAVRTASHGFQNWPEFDAEVLGGHYGNHLRNDLTMRARPPAGAKGHPVLRGVGEIASMGSLYKTSPLAADATPLLIGESLEGKEPAAWARGNLGGRVVYTSIGAPGDFENASYLCLLANALFWASGRDVPEPAPIAIAPRIRKGGIVRLTLRRRVPSADDPGRFEVRTTAEDVPASSVGIVICDMWDKHWCRGATERCSAIASEMAPLIEKARAGGVQIVHAPSDCLGFYEGTPGRSRMQAAPKVALAEVVSPGDVPPLPIDDSDGGCDTGDPMYLAWTRQHKAIRVQEPDGVSADGREVASFFKAEGITHVLVMGVHTNMCVLNRSFAIKQMTKWGFRCALVRDLTDTMYNPAMRPNVPHAKGTDLVIEHIETYWCPSITSGELLRGLPRE